MGGRGRGQKPPSAPRGRGRSAHSGPVTVPAAGIDVTDEFSSIEDNPDPAPSTSSGRTRNRRSVLSPDEITSMLTGDSGGR